MLRQKIVYCLLVVGIASSIKLAPVGSILPGQPGSDYFKMLRSVLELVLILPFFYYVVRRFRFHTEAGVKGFPLRNTWLILIPLFFPGLMLAPRLETSCGYWTIGFLIFCTYRFCAALFEELVFRGLLQGYLMKKDPVHSHQANILSALFFGLVHLMNLRHTYFPSVLAQVVFAFIMGLLLAAVFLWVRNIWIMGLGHALVNILMSSYCASKQPEIAPATFSFMDCLDAIFSMALVMSPALLIYFFLMHFYQRQKRANRV